MTVGEYLTKIEKLKEGSKDLQKLEVYLSKRPEFLDTIEDCADLGTHLDTLISAARCVVDEMIGYMSDTIMNLDLESFQFSKDIIGLDN